ncbi:hypothetical protein [Hymenobacter canadensis]|uniref:Uncharacterized protein n=1 Tax=Hymenobacter canadensis TaxID=2999067 RepID=A0ABY7LUU9_9BACT|nr:hypothetical protein [Hymenobacter canadensis]WBA44166.1 hypothetical protein O3303_19970 [Hymenobacter canadensis]
MPAAAAVEATERSPNLILRLTADGQPAYTNPAASAFERTLDEATAQALLPAVKATVAAELAMLRRVLAAPISTG